MFHFLFQEIHKPIILVLNPLDSLGNNQVNPIIFLLDYWVHIFLILISACHSATKVEEKNSLNIFQLATMQRQAEIVVTRHKQKSLVMITRIKITIFNKQHVFGAINN